MAGLKLYLFGPPRVELNAAPVDIERRKALALLVYLAVTGQPHSRDALATLFWPDLDQQRGRAYFRRDLAALNTSLPGGWLIADRETVELNRDAAPWVDTEQFQRLLATCQVHGHASEIVCADCLPLLTEAAALYTGDFLAGFTLRDSPEFDDWQFFQTESLRQELAVALERLGRGHSAQGEYEAAIPYVRRWVALDPLHEPAQRHLMQLYDGAGQPSAALRQYEEYVKLLEEELGLPPEETTTTLYEAVKARRIMQPLLKSEGRSLLQPSARAGQLPPAAAAGARPAPQPALPPGPTEPRPRPHNLPHQSTPFVGREKELAEIKHLLLADSTCRLVTLIGPGGIGKTRLGIEAARGLSASRRVCFVPLAPISSANFLISAIADELGLSFHGSADPKQQLMAYLRDKELLLVLDNFEHLLPAPEGTKEEGGEDGTTLVAEILGQAPPVKILVTSRERLNLSAEWVFTVPGLSFPEGNDLAGIESSSAVQLFIQRARQVRQHIGWHPMERASIVRICRLVGGMPLGIELAAAWVAILPVIEIPQEIERNLDFLSTTMRDLPERHRSMRAVFDQSWSLLTAPEQVVFRRLSIFRGGFTRAAVEAVCGDLSWSSTDLTLDEHDELQLPQRQFEVLNAIAGLVTKSFLRQTAAEAAAEPLAPPQTEGRYEVHELMRQYGAVKLLELPADEEQTYDRHAEYYLTLLAHLEPHMKGRGQRHAHEKVAWELENIKVAWRWAAEQSRTDLLIRSIEAFWLFHVERNLFREAERIITQTAALLETAPARADQPAARELVLGILLIVRGAILTRLGDDYTRSMALLDQGLALLRSAGAERWLGLGLNFKHATYLSLGAYEEERRCLTESIELSQRTGDRWLTAYSLNDLGMATYLLGDTAAAQRLSQQSLAIFVELDDQRGMAFAFNNLGFFAYQLGEYAEADWLYRESLSLRRVNGDQWGVANVLVSLGMVARAGGDQVSAYQNLLEAMRTAQEVRAVPVLLDALVELAALLGDAGEPERAASMLRASLHHPALSKQTRLKAETLLAALRHLAAPPPTALLPEDEAAKDLNTLVAALLNEQQKESSHARY
jgi:predicted ATPase/DNA-binding SARP family transcriptional activator